MSPPAPTSSGVKSFVSKLRFLKRHREEINKELRQTNHRSPLDDGDSQLAQRAADTVDKQLEDIEYMLSHAKVIQHANQKEIELGSTIQLQKGNHVTRYTLVDSVEADPSVGRISCRSSLGTALLGKHEDEDVAIRTFAGDQFYHINKIG